ncbi:MAG: hypothetical protein UR31_C0002G0050 [Parcubacteria group bacterium GW2011_GWA2_33_14]|nr:MAG: hypothetical protein UR31_C0002G0050 [Parcubacteria group bacterium GW2011_GWA2_33_14]
MEIEDKPILSASLDREYIAIHSRCALSSVIKKSTEERARSGLAGQLESRQSASQGEFEYS